MSIYDFPLVSVIMTVRNCEIYIEDALNSIIVQTYRNIELVVVDDHSTDGTGDIIRDFSERYKDMIRVIRNNRNHGVTSSLNIGIRAAKGKYIARQDGDDMSLPERIKKQVSFLQRYGNIAAVGVKPIVIDDKGRYQGIIDFPTAPIQIRNMLMQKRNVLCHGSIMMKRDLLEQTGYYREFFEVSQDRDLWLRMSEVYPLSNIPEPLYKWRFHEESVTARTRPEKLSYRMVMLDCARRRKEDGVDGFGLEYGGKWEERKSSYYRRGAVSYRLLVWGAVEKQCNHYFMAVFGVLMALLVWRRNRVARRFLNGIAREIMAKLKGRWERRFANPRISNV